MRYVRALRWAVAALAVAGLGWQLARLDSQGLLTLRSPSIVPLVAASGLGVASYIAFATAWARLRGRGESWRDVGGIWFASLFARYAPGGIWQGTLRAAGAHAAGESKRTAVERYFAEQMLACFSAAVTALVLITIAHVEIDRFIVLALVAVAVGAWSVAVVAPRWGVAVEWAWGAVVAMLIGHFAMALGFAVFISAWTTFDIRFVATSMTVFLVAGITGVLAVFVPAGLGVREAVIAGLLAPQIGVALAISLALASRLWLLGCEVGAWGTWALLARRRVIAQGRRR